MAYSEEIRKILGANTDKIFYDEPMSRHTSIKVGGNADALVMIDGEDQLLQIIGKLKQAKLNYLPAGNLTNIIVRDGGYRGAILLMKGLNEISYQKESDDIFYMRSGAGAALAQLVRNAEDQELTGVEFCAGIPGSIGGAVWMNAGAFGREIKDVVVDVTVLDALGQKRIMPREEISFGYRKTVLPKESIIINAGFKLKKGSGKQIREKISEIMQLRRKKHPLTYPNAGSIFKNLPGLPAGKLIEEMGFKGTRCGDAEVSSQHANFIVNKGEACAADVLELIELIQTKAKQGKNIILETEVIIVGEN